MFHSTLASAKVLGTHKLLWRKPRSCAPFFSCLGSRHCHWYLALDTEPFPEVTMWFQGASFHTEGTKKKEVKVRTTQWANWVFPQVNEKWNEYLCTCQPSNMGATNFPPTGRATHEANWCQKAGRLHWKFQADTCIYKLTEMEGNQSSVRAAPCGKWKAKALRSRTPAEDRRPRRQGECRGEAASSPCLAGPHPNPDFFSALFPSVQKYSEKNSQKGPSWLIHSQNSEVQGSLSRHPARAHSKAPCSAEQHRSRIWSRTSHRTLCYLIPLTPFSNQGPILFTAQDQPK